ncbi:MAG: hypothetical protein ABI898_13385 [Sphingomonadales bacterium]
MVYLVASIASLLLLSAGMAVIYSTVRANHGRIIGALLGQPMNQHMIVVRNARLRNRVRNVTRQPVQPLRAAA